MNTKLHVYTRAQLQSMRSHVVSSYHTIPKRALKPSMAYLGAGSPPG